MAAKLSKAIKLVGTDAPEPKSRILRAGPLTCEFGNGALRYIRINDVEVLRAIAFLVRDENWGTFTPVIKNLKVKQGRDSFAVSYDATCSDPKRSLTYHADISCDSKGTLSFKADAKPNSDFLTNRTGFTILHPLKGVAGFPVEVEYVDGRKEKSKFPSLINPACPFTGIRSLKHKVSKGLFATCRMEGYAFEMEDHRNWTDASFKTYVRPLAEPWPYVMKAGVAFSQAVTLSFKGKLPRPKKAGGAQKIDVEIGRPEGRMPQIGIAVPTEEAAAALKAAPLIKQAGPWHLVCHVDGREADIAAPMRHYRALAEATGAAVELEILLPGKAAPDAELARVVAAAKQSGLNPAAVSVSPAVDLKAVLPGSKGPDCPPLEDIYKAARTAFPAAKLGGGLFSFFTELNRKRPPAEPLDFVTHTTSPIVHAADDVSVMESLEALPYVIKSTRAFIGKTAYHLGPSAIPARQNPYGAASAQNPKNERVCLSRIDPRQRALFGAAWNLGYVAAFANGGLNSVTLGAATGPAGMIYRKTDHAQPYFDGLKSAAIYPVYHLIADLAAASGSKLLAVNSTGDGTVASLAYGGSGGMVLWLANLTPRAQTVRVKGLAGAAKLTVIDEASFGKATTDAAFLKKSGKKLAKVGSVALKPYAVARLAAIGK